MSAITIKQISTAMVALSLFIGTPAVATQQTFEFDLPANKHLQLDTQVGSIEVTTHKDDAIYLELFTAGDFEDSFVFDHSNEHGQLVLTGRLSEKTRRHYEGKVEFVLRVPEQFDLELDTHGGGIHIADLTGDVDARTSGGGITLISLHGNSEVHTSGGGIRVTDYLGALKGHTSGGGINASFSQPITDDIKLSTSGGSINITLPDDISLDLKASTSGGYISHNLALNGKSDRQSVKGSVNGGGPRLKLHTSGGNIRIRSH